MLKANPDLAKGHHLKQSFQRILGERDVEAFDAWLQEAVQSGVKPFQALSRSFYQDYEAITASFLKYSK